MSPFTVGGVVISLPRDFLGRACGPEKISDQVFGLFICRLEAEVGRKQGDALLSICSFQELLLGFWTENLALTGLAEASVVLFGRWK